MLKIYISGEKNVKYCLSFLSSIKSVSLLAVITILLFAESASAQTTANYSVFTGTSGSFAADRNSNVVDMTTGTTQIIAADIDDGNGSALISNIGFDFFLYGNRFTQFSVNSNGLIGLGSTAVGSGTYATSGGSITNPRISAFCADLRTGAAGKIHYKLVGSAPNRSLVIEFLNMSLLYVTSPGSSDGTFQVRLYETSGIVELMYGPMSRNAGTGATTSAVSVGLSVGTTAGTTISMTTSANTFSTGAAFNTNTYAASSGAITNLNSTGATTRRTYTFIPPGNPSHLVTASISSPTSLTFSGISTTGMTLNWVASSPTTGVLKYAIYNSTDNVNFSYVNSVALGTNTYAATGLTTGTTYYWKVYPLSEGRLGTALTGSEITVACLAPTAQPTSLNLTAITNTTLSGAFSAASPVPSGYLVVRSTSSTLSSNPVDGTTYVAGNTFGGGTVIQSGTATTFSQTGLTANTQYYYFVFSYNSCSSAPKYFTTAPLTANAYTCLAAPTSSAATATTGTGFTANWATVTGATGYLLDVSTVNTFASFVAGYNGLAVSGGSTVSQAVTSLSANTTYYYRVRATNATSCTSASSATQTVYTGHCLPTVTSGTNAYITNFSTTSGVLNISNTSGFTATAYQDNYAAMAVSMYASGTINYSFTLATTSLKAAVAIWVDWNNNLVFETSERVYLSPGYIDSGTYSGTITVPGGTALGNYRLRIKSDYSSTSPDPCTTSVGTNAETEDYKFTVIAVPTDAVDYANIQSPGVSTTVTGTPTNIFGQAYEPGLTPTAGAPAGLTVWYSTNATDVDPSSVGWTGAWTAATYNAQVGNNDEWKAIIYPISGQADTYYSFRYQLNGGPFKYGGYNSSGGGFWDGTTYKNGKLSVNYDVYTNSTPKTINDVIDIYFKDFDVNNMMYTGSEATVYMYGGVQVAGVGFQYIQGDLYTLSSLLPFTYQSPGLYKATVRLSDYFCIPTGTIVEGVNVVFRNQYFTGGTCDGSAGNNNKTCDLFLDLTDAAVQLNVPTLTAATAITTTTATINWTAPTSGTIKGYEYYYSTSATAPISSTTPSGSTAAGVLSANLTLLAPSTLYNVWVRTKGCSTYTSAWSAVRTFTTLVAPPANDACANATSLPCATVALAGTTVASVSEVLAVAAWNASAYGVWYTFVGDGTLNLISTTAGSGFDHKLSIASGTCGALTNVTTVDVASGGGTETYSFIPVLGTVYYVYISYYGSSGTAANTGTFTISRTCNIPLVYCTPSSSAASAANNYIQNVSFLGTLNDISNTSTFSSTSAGYENFTGLASHPSQIQSEAVNVHVTMNNSLYLKAWVDWNKDGDFTDLNEEVYNSNGIGQVATTFGFQVPVVTPGDYRIRIRARSNPTFDSCSSNNNSDSEDYLLTVIGRCAVEILTITDGQRCGSGVVNLSATATSGTTSFKWYSALTGGTLLATTATGSYSPTVTNTTSFYVTAYDGTCETQIRKEVVAVVKELPLITLPTTLEACGDKTPIILSAGADSETVYLIDEDFESATSTFSSVENGTANSIAKWRLKTSTFKPFEAKNSWLPAISSGFGANKFMTATSDLTDASFDPYSLDNALQPTVVLNTTGFLNLTLKFRMYFSRYNTDNLDISPDDEFVSIEVSTNGGSTWIPAPVIKYTSDIGNPGNFASISLNLDSYINQSNLKFRIRYKTTAWTDGVGVDDIQLYGEKTLVPSFTWSGAGLNVFQDVALTIPYVAGTPASTVYAIPDVATLGNTTFNIDVSTTVTNGCTITKTINVTNKSKVWNGSVSTAWENANNWSPVGIPSTDACIIIPSTTVKPIISDVANGKNLAIKSSGELLVNSDKILTIQDAVNVDAGGKITFENNSSLIQVNESPTINSGDIIYKRNSSNMLRYSYSYWSSPIFAATQTLAALSPATLHDKYWSWDIASQAWTMHDYGNIVMQKAKGYIVRAPQTFPITGTAASYNATFTGVPNNGLLTIATKGSTTANKWNLLGNPYPSALSADLFLANAVNPDLEGTIYLWTNFAGVSSVPNSGGTYPYTPSDYAVYNFTGSTATAPATGGSITPSGFIAAGQSFFVKGISAGDGIATFKNTMRKGENNNQFFKNAATQDLVKNRFWLNLENTQGLFNQALVGYIEGATDSYDRGFDGEVFGTAVNLYSIIPNKNLTIQGKSLPFQNTDVVKLGYKATVAGNHKITLDHFDDFFMTQEVFLKDNLLNVIHDIKNAPYSFASAIGTFDERFEIVYQRGNLGIENPSFDPNSILIYKKDKDVIVNAGNVEISELKVFDIQGRLLYNAKNVNNKEAVIKNLPSTEQVLIVQVRTVNGNLVSKKLLYLN